MTPRRISPYYRDGELLGNLRCGCQVGGEDDMLVRVCAKHQKKGLRRYMIWKQWGPLAQELQRELEQGKLA